VKAIAYRQYGSPGEVLGLEDIETPAPGDDEVLVRVVAAAVNPLDWHLVRGRPYFLRMMTGLRKPKSPRLGGDVAGRVEAVGKNVARFSVGDPVFGTLNGSFAEYGCAVQTRVALKPDSVTFEQAATIGIAGLTALQGLRDKGEVKAGEEVLINGASGGVGTFAVQIAKTLGAKITGVCSSRNVDMVRSLGADHVVDYTREDFTGLGARYDVLLDCVGNHSLSEYRRVLNPGGRGVLVGGPDRGWAFDLLFDLISARLLSAVTSQRLSPMLGVVNQEDLMQVADLVASGKLAPVIDTRYPLEQVPDALRYVEAGHARGKVVITVE
jgi:NADPH:quinone reductase-like Zn-dependent oxidoreductase